MRSLDTFVNDNYVKYAQQHQRDGSNKILHILQSRQIHCCIDSSIYYNKQMQLQLELITNTSQLTRSHATQCHRIEWDCGKLYGSMF